MLSALAVQKILESSNSETSNIIFDLEESLVTVKSSDIFNSYDYYLAITYKNIQNLNIATSSYINSYYKFRTIKSIEFSGSDSTQEIFNFSGMFPNIETVYIDENTNIISTSFENSSLNSIYFENVSSIISYCFYGCKNFWC